jgi:hypothetical protein
VIFDVDFYNILLTLQIVIVINFVTAKVYCITKGACWDMIKMFAQDLVFFAV